FFQAEDGIRDRNVTGVQTCALPISEPRALFPETDSWYTGANVQGKPRVVLPYLGGVGSFDHMLNEQADTGYPAFDFTSRSALSEIGRASCRERVTIQEGWKTAQDGK